MKNFTLIRILQFSLLSLQLFLISFFAQASDSTFFRDDFNRASLGNFWKAAPAWSVVQGSAYSFIDGTGGTLRTAENYNELSYIIETKAKGFTGSYMREFRITFGQNNLSNDSMYVLSYKPHHGSRLTLSISTDNIYSAEPLDEVIIDPALTSTKWYTFKIAKYKSGLIQVYINKGGGYGKTPLLETIDTSYRSAGHIGWQTDTQTFAESFFVDWITAYKPPVEKQTKEKQSEDNLITQVSAKSGKSYKVHKLANGEKIYSDRDYTITSLPAYLNKASFIQTAMDDKKDKSEDFLTFYLKKDAIIYIGYDSRLTTKPSWLKEWTKTGERISTNDPGSPFLEVYSKLAESGEVYPYSITLGGNLASPASGSETNYIVAAVERPGALQLQAEDALLSGAVIANDHPGYEGTGFVDYKNLSGDFIEWSVKIDVPGTYNLGFSFSNGSKADRLVVVKGDSTHLGLLSFSDTWSWSSWAFLDGPDVFFSKGLHKIRATATGTSGPNIDQLSLSYISSAPPVLPAKRISQKYNIVNNPFDNSPKVYPNPFNQTAEIKYVLTQKAKVLLSIYNLQGQQVQVLVNSMKDAGVYKATFNANNLSSGFYFYRLQTGNEVKVGRLVKN